MFLWGLDMVDCIYQGDGHKPAEHGQHEDKYGSWSLFRNQLHRECYQGAGGARMGNGKKDGDKGYEQVERGPRYHHQRRARALLAPPSCGGMGGVHVLRIRVKKKDEGYGEG